VGDSRNGWGEDGRIVWTLRTLGHDRGHLVNGGATALLAARPLPPAPASAPGDFTAARTDSHTITKEDLRAGPARADLVILDAREPRKHAGATAYGESRGGHSPGARSLYFSDLIGPDGYMLDGDALRSRLDALGIGPETTVVSYCTAGIRSGFVTAVLQSTGIDARNFAGSMWEWAAAPEAEYPLETQ
jgi:thiosulfate/3-mercaptopyruvate sulfurtransferase